MHKIATLAVTGLMMLSLSGLPALAAGPEDAPGAGPPQAGQPLHDQSYLLEGEPFAYSGVVGAVNYYRGGGLTLAVDSGTVTLYGLGPWWYWEQQGVNWPQVGDSLSVTGYAVDIGGSLTRVLMTVTTQDGKTIQLRDASTGWPLWMARQ